MHDVIEKILTAWKIYWGDGFYAYLLLLAVLYLLVFHRKKEWVRQVIWYVVLMLALFFCPVTAWVIQKCVGSSVYWRVLWILPAFPLIAWAGTLLIEKFGKNNLFRVILLVVAAGVICFCGKNLKKADYYEKVNNYQKVPDEVAQICNLISSQKEEGEEVYLATDDELSSYIRVYDPSIRMPYGRGGKSASNKRAQKLYTQLIAEVPVIKKVVRYAKELNCNYLVFPLPSEKKQDYMARKGFQLIGQVNQYGIFHYVEE